MINLKLLSTAPSSEQEKKHAAALFLFAVLLILKGTATCLELIVWHPSPLLYKMVLRYLALCLSLTGLAGCIYRIYSYRLWVHLCVH